MSAMTSARLRALRAAILPSAPGAARRHAAGEYALAEQKTPRPERLLAGLLDALSRRYTAGEYRAMGEAVEQAKEASR